MEEPERVDITILVPLTTSWHKADFENKEDWQEVLNDLIYKPTREKILMWFEDGNDAEMIYRDTLNYLDKVEGDPNIGITLGIYTRSEPEEPQILQVTAGGLKGIEGGGELSSCFKQHRAGTKTS